MEKYGLLYVRNKLEGVYQSVYETSRLTFTPTITIRTRILFILLNLKRWISFKGYYYPTL